MEQHIFRKLQELYPYFIARLNSIYFDRICNL